MDNPLITPDPGLFIWTIVTFLVLLVLLRKFAWAPLMAALARREQMIEKTVEDARQVKEELKQVQEDSAKLLAQARVEAQDIVSRSRSDAERLREEMRQKAGADAAALVANAERQIQLEANRAIQQIRHEAGDLSIAIASKILGRAVSRADNDNLIQDAIKQIDSAPS